MLYTDTSLRAENYVLNLRRLPVCTPVLKKILEMLRDPLCSVRSVTEVVEKEPVFCARILGLAAGGQDGLAPPQTVEEAVMRVGVARLEDLATTLAAHPEQDGARPGRDYPRHWRRAVTAASSAAIIAAQAPVLERSTYIESNPFYIAGLTHHLGELAMSMQDPDRFSYALEIADREKMEAIQAEKRVFGFCHVEVGAALLRQMGLSAALCDAAAFHHEPEFYEGSHFRLVQVTHLASIFCHENENPAQGGLETDQLRVSVWKELGFESAQLVQLGQKLASHGADLDKVLRQLLKDAESPVWRKVA